MFADAHDVLINARADKIIEKFIDMNVRVLFSADFNCVPDPDLCPKYGLSLNSVNQLSKFLLSSGTHHRKQRKNIWIPVYLSATHLTFIASSPFQISRQKEMINFTSRKSFWTTQSVESWTSHLITGVGSFKQ